MARTGKALSPIFVKNLVIKVARREGILLNENRLDAIDKILSTLPPNPNPTWIIRWYSYKTKKEILKRFQYKLKAKVLCTGVYKEIFYFLNQDEFIRLTQLLISNPPEKINPQWIRKNAYALSVSIRRTCAGVRTLDGRIDWEFVFKKLKVNNFCYRKTIPRRGDKEKIIKDLVNVLETEDPEIFYYEWLEKNCGPIAKQLQIMFKSNWLFVISLLDKKWQKRWRYYGAVQSVDWYINRKEFSRVLERYRHKLYLVYVDIKSERNLRNKMMLDFLFIVQKGNLLARDFLIDSVKLTLYDSDQLSDWHKFNGLLEEKIERCILRFDLVKGDNFYNYLYKSVKFFALPFVGLNAFSINESTCDSSQEISESLLTQSQKEDVEEFIRGIKLALVQEN